MSTADKLKALMHRPAGAAAQGATTSDRLKSLMRTPAAGSLANLQKQKAHDRLMADPIQRDTLKAAELGIPFTAPTPENIDRLNAQKSQAIAAFGLDSPEAAAINQRQNELKELAKRGTA
jgi:hypothetical protein